MSDTPRRIEYVRLADIKSAVRNVKAHDVGELTQSIRRFGFNDAVVVDDRTGRLLAGHGRVDALRAMHKEDAQRHPAGVRVKGEGATPEWLVPVQRGWASRDDTEAEAFIVAANRLVELGGWDEPGLEAVLADLARDGALEGTGYDGDDVDRLLNHPAIVNGTTDALAEWEGMPEFDQRDKTSLHQLVVHFKSTVDLEAFANLVAQKLTTKTRAIWFPPVEIETYADKAYVDAKVPDGQ